MNKFIKSQNNDKQTPKWIKLKIMLLTKNMLIIFLIFLCSCKEEEMINLNKTNDPQLVVFSEMTDIDKKQVIYLSKTFSDFSIQEENIYVKDAKISIYEGIDTIKFKEDIKKEGSYYTYFIPEPDKTYTLFIENVDINNDGTNETYTAEATMGKTMKIDNLCIIYDFIDKGWKICMTGNEPEETTNYYLFKVYRNDTLITKKLTDYRVSKDEFYNGGVLENVIVQFLDEDEGQIFRTKDKITLDVEGITKGYYQFLHDVMKETDDDLSFFQGPSAQISGNISNNALGYFAIMAVSRASCIYRE